MAKKRRKTNKIVATVLITFAVLLFMAGLYLLPIGTDIYLYFFVEVLMHGNWLYGDILANLVAVGMIAVGFLMLRAEGVKPGLKKDRKKKRR